jgi:hypothetical protein
LEIRQSGPLCLRGANRRDGSGVKQMAAGRGCVWQGDVRRER